MGLSWLSYSSLIYTSELIICSTIQPLSRLLLYTANAIPPFSVRDGLTLVLMTLREKTGCQQTMFDKYSCANMYHVMYECSCIMEYADIHTFPLA